MHYLDQAFEIGGVPKRLKTDNMKTVMDHARSEYKKENKVFNSLQMIMDLKFIHVLQDIPSARERLKTL